MRNLYVMLMPTQSMRIFGPWLLVLPLLAAPLAQSAESYPLRPVRIVVPTGAGGITDILARMIGQKLGERLAQQVIIDNRDGANGIVGSQLVATAAPDGYTLLMVYPAHPVNPSLMAKMPYDTVKSFAPIAMVSELGLVLVTNPSLPVKSVRELIAFSKQHPAPDQLWCGRSGQPRPTRRRVVPLSNRRRHHTRRLQKLATDIHRTSRRRDQHLFCGHD